MISWSGNKLKPYYRVHLVIFFLSNKRKYGIMIPYLVLHNRNYVVTDSNRTDPNRSNQTQFYSLKFIASKIFIDQIYYDL